MVTITEGDDNLRTRIRGRTDNPDIHKRIKDASGKALEAIAWQYGIERRVLGVKKS